MRANSLTIEISQTAIRVFDGTTCVKTEKITASRCVPVVKWAGGKQWLARAAPVLAPPQFGRYYEPFAGGASFYFALYPQRATISDANHELIETYQVLRRNTEELIRRLQAYRYDESFFYSLRRSRPRTAMGRAARLLYLNRSCWNGLYRLNAAGQFNTPFGRYKNPTICDEPRLRAAAKLLRRTQLRVGDFESMLLKVKKDDFVYLDPPYITGHTNNGFVKYNARLFAWADQVRLAECVRRLAQRGVHVLVSNADHDAVIKLYNGLHHYKVLRRTLIGSEEKSRRIVSESLISSFPLFNLENLIKALPDASSE